MIQFARSYCCDAVTACEDDDNKRIGVSESTCLS